MKGILFEFINNIRGNIFGKGSFMEKILRETLSILFDLLIFFILSILFVFGTLLLLDPCLIWGNIARLFVYF